MSACARHLELTTGAHAAQFVEAEALNRAAPPREWLVRDRANPPSLTGSYADGNQRSRSPASI